MKTMEASMNDTVRKRLNRAWAIRSGAFDEIAQQTEKAGPLDDLKALLGIRPVSMHKDGGTAVIYVHGVMATGVSPMDELFGLIDTDHIAALARDAAGDPEVERIVFDIDSPGGMVAGVPELGELVRAIDKPTVAYTEGQMCSAAYWLGASCDQIIAAPSADVGSIGVYMAIADYSQAAEDAGIKVHLVASGDLKGMGLPGTEVTDPQLAHLQSEVTDLFEEFVQHVEVARGPIDPKYTRGQSIRATVAVDAGLVDRTMNPHLAEDGMALFSRNKQDEDLAARDAMAEMEEENAGLRAKVEDLADKLVAAEGKISNLQAANDEAVSLLNKASATLTEREDRIAELMADVDELKDALANPAAEYADATDGTEPVADTSAEESIRDYRAQYAQIEDPAQRRAFYLAHKEHF